MSRNNFPLSDQASEPSQSVVELAQIEPHQAAGEDLDGLLVGTVVIITYLYHRTIGPL
jgi:hypothetical protein